MKRIQLFILSIAAITASSLFSMQPAADEGHESLFVFSFDLDDVMSSKEKVNMYAFGWIGLRAFIGHPYIITIIADLNAMQEKGKKVAATVNGTANIVHAMIDDLNKQGYGDLSGYEDEIIEYSVNPKPIMRMVNNVQRLRGMGYTIIGATNQDYKQYLAYRKKMKDNYNVDLDALFNAVLTTRVLHMQPPTTTEPFFVPQPGPATVYQLIDPLALKPTAPYYQALTALAQKITQRKNVTVIHTDDKSENTQGARNANMGFLEFTLTGENARKTSPADLNKTIDTWEATLNRRFGVDINPKQTSLRSQEATPGTVAL